MRDARHSYRNLNRPISLLCHGTRQLCRKGPSRSLVHGLQVPLSVLMIALALASLTGCESGQVSFKPAFLPIRLVIGARGEVSVIGEASIATFLGTFSIGAEYSLEEMSDCITVTIRDRSNGPYGTDTIYRVKTDGDRLVAILDGTTVVEIEDDAVLVDVTEATVQTIEFTRAGNAFPATNAEIDIIPVTAIKTIAVAVVLAIAVVATVATGLVDVVLALFGHTFPATTWLWDFAWQTVTLEWFWASLNPIGAAIGAVALVFLCWLIRVTVLY